MTRKEPYSKKILKILGQKSAISLSELANRVNTHNDTPTSTYALTRSLKGLKKAGLIENISSPQNDYARLTPEGKKRINSLKLDSDTSIVNTSWDGLWRIILLDFHDCHTACHVYFYGPIIRGSHICRKLRLCTNLYTFVHFTYYVYDRLFRFLFRPSDASVNGRREKN